MCFEVVSDKTVLFLEMEVISSFLELKLFPPVLTQEGRGGPDLWITSFLLLLYNYKLFVITCIL